MGATCSVRAACGKIVVHISDVSSGSADVVRRFVMSVRKTKRKGLTLTLAFGAVTAGCLVFTVGCPALQPPGGDDTGGVGDSGVTGDYIGAATCALCHSKLHDGWAATAHAKAFESLEAIGQIFLDVAAGIFPVTNVIDSLGFSEFFTQLCYSHLLLLISFFALGDVDI